MLGYSGPLRRDLDSLRVEVGRLHAARVHDVAQLEDAEFRVFSQFGEDGIIQWLAQRVPLGERTFVEFGVENYRESNTRPSSSRWTTGGGWPSTE